MFSTMNQIYSRASVRLRSKLCLLFSNYCNSTSKQFLYFHRETRGEEICKKDDTVDFFGIICHGVAEIPFETSNNKDLGIGSMIGHMNFADLSIKEKYEVTITAKTDGLIALIPFGEEKIEMRRSAAQVSKTLLFNFKSLDVQHQKSCILAWNEDSLL